MLTALAPHGDGRRFWIPLTLQNARPIELEVGVVGFDQAEGVFIEGRATDPNAGWCAEPVENPGTALPPSARWLDDRGVFVSALVLREPELRQDYFPFLALGAGFATDLAGVAGGFFLTTGLTAGVLATGFSAAGLSARGLAIRGPPAFFISAGVALWTRVKRVWSPIV